MRERIDSIKGAIWNTLGSMVYGANSFIMLAMVSQISTVEQTGCFAIAFTTAQILYIVGLLGVPHYHMTDYEEKYNFIDYASVRIFSILMMAIGCVCVIWGLHYTAEKVTYTIGLTVLMMLNVVGELYQCLFFQKKRLDLSGSALFYRTFFSLILFCAALLVTRNILIAIFVQVLVNFSITLYYACVVARPFLNQKATLSSNNVRALIWECFPIFISLLFMNLIINASKFGIEFLLDNETQGYYNMIFMPVQVINMGSQFILKPILNRFAELIYGNQNKKFVILLRQQILLVALFTILCCFATYWWGAPVLGIFYGTDLLRFAFPLTLVVFGGGIFAVCQIYYYIFVILRKQTYILKIYSQALLIAVFITYTMVNHFGLAGAVSSFVVVHIIILSYYVWALHRIRRKNDA